MTKFKSYNPQDSNAKSLEFQASEFNNTSVPYYEVSGLMDEFMNLEEIAPGCTMEDILADTWGVPSPHKVEISSHQTNGLSWLIRATRSIVQLLRSKKFEVA